MEDVVEDIGPKDEDEEGHLQHPPSLEGPHGHAHTTRGLPIKKYPCVTLQVKSQWEGFPSGFTTDQVFTVQIYVKKWQIPGLCHTVYKVSVMYTKLPRKEGELFSWALPQKMWRIYYTQYRHCYPCSQRICKYNDASGVNLCCKCLIFQTFDKHTIVTIVQIVV